MSIDVVQPLRRQAAFQEGKNSAQLGATALSCPHGRVPYQSAYPVIDTARKIWEQGVSRWPQLVLPLELVTRRLSKEATISDIRHPADLYLACACANGFPAAIAIFEGQFLIDVDAFVARINPTRSFADEVKQRLRERLLVGPAARIVDYRGYGPLGAWLRMAAMRVAIDVTRAEGGPRAEAVEDLATRALDPELHAIKVEHSASIEEALRGAVARLSPRERNVLRMHFVSGWTFARIARTYHVHRATVMRWIEDIRQRLLDDLVLDVGDKLALDIERLRSLVGVLRSQLDASLSGLGDEL